MSKTTYLLFIYLFYYFLQRDNRTVSQFYSKIFFTDCISSVVSSVVKISPRPNRLIARSSEWVGAQVERSSSFLV